MIPFEHQPQRVELAVGLGDLGQRLVRIASLKGERWFCEEAEAVQVGWRAARFR